MGLVNIGAGAIRGVSSSVGLMVGGRSSPSSSPVNVQPLLGDVPLFGVPSPSNALASPERSSPSVLSSSSSSSSRLGTTMAGDSASSANSRSNSDAQSCGVSGCGALWVYLFAGVTEGAKLSSPKGLSASSLFDEVKLPHPSSCRV
jgi:hypothetical protein